LSAIGSRIGLETNLAARDATVPIPRAERIDILACSTLSGTDMANPHRR
jgi:hypothetical protein